MRTSFPIAITSAALSDDLRAAARVSRSLGAQGLLLDAGAGGGTLFDLSQTGQREVRQLFASQDQVLVGLSASLPGKGLRPEADIELALYRVEQVLNAARGLQAQLVCLDIGPLPPAPRVHRDRPSITPEQAGLIILPEAAVEEREPLPAPEKADPAFVASLTDALRELGRRADRYSVPLAFRSQLAGFAALEQALRLADCPWFGVDLDPVAVLEDQWSLDEVLSRLGSLVRHVRARDAIRGADRRTQPAPVGGGDTDWNVLLATLDTGAYRGWITIDPVALRDRVAGARAALAHLERVKST